MSLTELTRRIILPSINLTLDLIALGAFEIQLGPTNLAFCGEELLDQQYLTLLSNVVAGGPDGDSPITGFSPRKQNLTIYIMPGVEKYGSLLSDLGKYKTGKVCIYINKLDDVDVLTLREIVKQSVDEMNKKYNAI